jgi:hypothetical protein
MTRIVFVAVALASLALSTKPTLAEYYHESPWCAVLDMGKGAYWDCQYRSFEQCGPTVLAGNRGWCNPNPYFVSDRAAAYAPYRKHHARPQ